MNALQTLDVKETAPRPISAGAARALEPLPTHPPDRLVWAVDIRGPRCSAPRSAGSRGRNGGIMNRKKKKKFSGGGPVVVTREQSTHFVPGVHVSACAS